MSQVLLSNRHTATHCNTLTRVSKSCHCAIASSRRHFQVTRTKSPISLQKSPISPQKSPISPQKSPISPQSLAQRLISKSHVVKALWRYRALLRRYRALLRRFRALLSHVVKYVYTHVRLVYTCCKFVAGVLQCRVCTLMTRVHASDVVSSRRHFQVTRIQPYIYSKETYIHTKEPYIYTKKPTYTQKSPTAQGGISKSHGRMSHVSHMNEATHIHVFEYYQTKT